MRRRLATVPRVRNSGAASRTMARCTGSGQHGSMQRPMKEASQGKASPGATRPSSRRWRWLDTPSHSSSMAAIGIRKR